MAKSSSSIKLPFLASKAPDEAVISQVCGWADEGEIERAGNEIERQLRAGSYCTEIFTIWLSFRFAGRGLAELPGILRDVEVQVRAEDRSGVTGRAWERGLSWLAASLRERVKFHAKARDATWQRWCGQLGEPLDAALSDALARLRGPVSEQAESQTKTPLQTFGEEVELLYRRTFGQLVADVRDAAAEPEAPPRVEEAAPGEDEPSPARAAAPPPATPPGDAPRSEDVPQPSSTKEPPPLRSGPLDALRAKLAAFERLAANGTWPMAAMVARDVEQELSQFDPIRYFPELFSGYLRALSQVGAELEPYMQQDGSLESQAIERLYRADPRHFLSELSLREASGK